MSKKCKNLKNAHHLKKIKEIHLVLWNNNKTKTFTQRSVNGPKNFQDFQPKMEKASKTL